MHSGHNNIGYIIAAAMIGLFAACSSTAVLKPAKPLRLTYKIINTFPHDTSAYTQGLSYVHGKLLESTGRKGASSLRWVDLNSGKVLQQVLLDTIYFGEGSVKVDDRIIMLTWQECTGLVFDAASLRQTGSFPYQYSKEGWGLTFDGKQLWRSDGTHRIWRMNKDTFQEEGYIEVTDHKGIVRGINELEFIGGKIYANIYPENKIVLIDSGTGKVVAQCDLSALVPKHFFKNPFDEYSNVLNGIAWDEAGKRLFVGGKKWPFLYQIELIWPK